MNPYQILGLDPKSTTAQIKTKFRRLAKQHHPDAGGDPVMFERITMAYQLLCDDERRKHFDATGEVMQKTPDNRDAYAYDMLANAFDVVLQECGQAQREPSTLDLVAEIKRNLGNRKAQMGQERDAITRHMPKWRKLQARFKRKGAGGNFFESVLNGKIQACESRLADLERWEKAVERGLELLADYSFDVEKVLMAPRQQGWTHGVPLPNNLFYRTTTT